MREHIKQSFKTIKKILFCANHQYNYLAVVVLLPKCTPSSHEYSEYRPISLFPSEKYMKKLFRLHSKNLYFKDMCHLLRSMAL
jgi:hypothetical protein